MLRVIHFTALATVAYFFSNNVLFAQQVALSGRVVDERDRPLATVTVEAERAGRIIATARTDGQGEFAFSVDDGAPIDSISFFRTDRHPGFVENISGNRNAQEELSRVVINKVLFPRVGPEGYVRNLDQLLAYERIYYISIGRGIDKETLREKYADLLLGMPDPSQDSPQLSGITPAQRRLLQKKRAEVFALYRINREPLRLKRFIQVRGDWTPQGFKVTEVKRGGPATRMKSVIGNPVSLEPGDVIVEVEGIKIKSQEDYIRAMNNAPDPDRISILLRDWRTGTLITCYAESKDSPFDD